MKSSLLTNKLIFPLLPVWVPNLNESFPIRVRGIPMFLCSLMNCVIMVWVSPADAIMHFNSYTLHRVSTINQCREKTIASMSARFEWEFPSNPYVSLFPDVLCNKGLSVTDWRKILFNGYTLHQLSTINQFTRETRIRTVRVDNFRLE